MHIHLKEARLRKRLTQAAVAAAIGRDQATVSKYESGASKVDPAVAPKLAEVLGIGVLEVLYGPNSDVQSQARVA